MPHTCQAWCARRLCKNRLGVAGRTKLNKAGYKDKRVLTMQDLATALKDVSAHRPAGLQLHVHEPCGWAGGHWQLRCAAWWPISHSVLLCACCGATDKVGVCA